MEKKFTFQEFVEIVKELRSENGCPWDKEQTHESLRACMTEEAAEVNAAIRVLKNTGDSENLCEELGDVLLQVVMHSEIAREQEEFLLEDVISMVSEKMIRRHPHVFGDVKADDSKQVLNNWEDIKKQEKIERTSQNNESILREIPLEFPALLRGEKVWKKAEAAYDISIPAEESIEKIENNIDKLVEKDSVEEALGEILFQLTNIGKTYKLNLEQILTDKIEKFIENTEK